jgi:hypothetical protein
MNHMQKMRDLETIALVNHDIAFMGSAEVRRGFQLGERAVRRGEILSREELLTIAPRNLRAMCSNRFLTITLDPNIYLQTRKEKNQNATRSAS